MVKLKDVQGPTGAKHLLQLYQARLVFIVIRKTAENLKEKNRKTKTYSESRICKFQKHDSKIIKLKNT